MKKVVVQGRPFALEPCGIKNFSFNFFAHLSQKLKDYEFKILVPNAVAKDEFVFGTNVEFVVIKPVPATPDYLSTLLWENNQTLDYINTLATKEVAFYISPYNCLPLTKLNIPEFVVLHDIDLWIDRGIKWPVERQFGYEIKRRSIYNADLILTISNFSKKEIDSFFQIYPNKTKVIYEDIDPRFSNKDDFDTSKILEAFKVEENNYFLYIGGFELRKNPEALFEAYYHYLKKVSNPKKLLVLGSFNQRTNKQIKFNLSKLKDNCIFVSRPLEFKEIASAYKDAFAFIYPSKYEGFGLQILEAQSLGTSLIVSDIAIFKEIAGNGALYFNPDKPEDISSKMIELETNPSLRSKLISKGYENRSRFSWDKTTTTFINQINKYL